MKYSILKNSSGVILPIYIQDLTSPIGGGLTGVLPSTSGIKCYYKKNIDSSITSFNLRIGTVGTYVASGLIEISAANAPGDYELCLPQAAFSATASGNVFLTATLYNIPNALPTKIDIQLVDPPIYPTFNYVVNEPSTAPSFPSNLNDAVAFILQRTVNKETCTSTLATVYKSDGTTPVATANITDDGSTLTRERFV